MSVFEKMASTQAQMFIYLLVGAIISKTGVLKKEARSSFLALLVKVTIPVMILHSFEMTIEGDAVSLALQDALSKLVGGMTAVVLAWFMTREQDPI